MKEEFSHEYVDSCSKFDEIFLKVLNRHAPLKKKMLRANHAPYVSKALRKAIMKRSCLENVYFKKQDNHSLRAYKKQKNYCSRLYKKERKKFFNNLNPKFVSDNKSFWKTVKPLFSSKGSYNANIKLTDKDEIIQNDKNVAETLNSFFENAVSSLKLNENSFVINNEHKNIQEPIEKIIVKYFTPVF